MTDHPDFLPAILEHPGDDAARLVYADYLEESGQEERAEFIRVQCEAERLDRIVNSAIFAPGPPRNTGTEFGRLCALRRRERELRGQDIRLCIHCDWHRPIPHGGWSWEFRRGFVESVTCTAEEWEANGAGVLAAQPVTKLEFVGGVMLGRGRMPLQTWRSRSHQIAGRVAAGDSQGVVNDQFAEHVRAEAERLGFLPPFGVQGFTPAPARAFFEDTP